MYIPVNSIFQVLTSALNPALCGGLIASLLLALSVGCAVGPPAAHTFLDWFIFASLGAVTGTCIASGVSTARGAENDDDDATDINTVVNDTYSMYSMFSSQLLVHIGIIMAFGSFLQVTGVVGWTVATTTRWIVPFLRRGFEFIVGSFTDSSCVSFVAGVWTATKNMVASGCTRSAEMIDHTVRVLFGPVQTPATPN
jgi:hypothetical protein